MTKVYNKFSKVSCLLAAIGMLIYLGLWQLDRAQQKKSIISDLTTRLANKPIIITNSPNILTQQFNKIRFTPVVTTGKFLNQYTFLLDNQIQNHQAGYRIITPFRINSPNLNKLLLIDRGWVKAPLNRKLLPSIPEINGDITVNGIINRIPAGIVLVADTPHTINPRLANFPYVIQALDYQLLTQILQQPIFDFVIQAKDQVSLGISWQKHLGYAVQWFALALAMIVYSLIVWRRWKCIK